MKAVKVPVLAAPPADAAGMAKFAAALRAAGERWSAVPLGERIEAVARAATVLSDSGSPLRREAVEGFTASSGRARAMTEESLDFFLGKLTGDALAAEARRVGVAARQSAAPRLTAHWLAGNTPWAGLESVAAACLAGSASFVKAARAEPHFARAWTSALAAAHPSLGAALAVSHAPGGSDRATEDALFAACDALVVFGEDATIEALRARVRQRAAGALRFVPHGHRLSVAALGRGAWRRRASYMRVALDHAVEDQDGCLSPRSVYLIGEDDAAARQDADDFADSLALAMAFLELRWPRGPVAPEDAARVQQLRAAAEFSGRRVVRPQSTAWTVLLDDEATFEPAPAARFVWLRRVASADALALVLEPVRGRLAAFAYGDEPGDAGALPPVLAAIAPGYRPRVGTMQRPPLGWNHDGASDLEWLLGAPSPKENP